MGDEGQGARDGWRETRGEGRGARDGNWESGVNSKELTDEKQVQKQSE